MENPSVVGCFPCRSRRRRTDRVAPSPDTSNLLEVRPDRYLNVLRHGPNLNVSSPPDFNRQQVDPNTGLMDNVGVYPDGQCAIFFLHGVGGSSSVWKHQYEYFAHIGFDVIIPEVLGHGLSAAPRRASDYHFNHIALDLLAVFDRFHKGKNVVIGHSYGSSFATLIAKERENLVTKLVLISGGGPTPLGPQSGVFQLPVPIMSCFKSCIVNSLLKKAFYKNHDSTVRSSAFRIPSYVLRHVMRGQDWLNGDEDYHESLLVPSLLIYGEHDQLVSMEEEVSMTQCLNASQLTVIDSASHMVMMERPDLVNKHIQQFLAMKQWRFSSSATENNVVDRNGVKQRPSPFY